MNQKRLKKEQKALLTYILEIKQFKLNEGAEYGQDRCTICLEHFSDNQEVCSLLCMHIFHKRCIGNWLKGKERANMNCPVCNKNVIPSQAVAGIGNPENLEPEAIRQRIEEVEQSDTRVPGQSTNTSLEISKETEV